MSDSQEAVKIAGDWAKQLALWTTGTLVLTLGFLKDFVRGQTITCGWWFCLGGAWLMLIVSLICGHLALGAPLTGAEKDLRWRLKINDETRWLSAIQLGAFVLGLLGTAVFVAFHISASPAQVAAAPQMWKPAACIGPFASGKSNQLEQTVRVADWIRCGDISSSAKLIRDSCEQGDGCQLMLVGSADKLRLGRGLEVEFGSNEGLARARAEWVREQFMSALSLDPSRFLVLTVGPREHDVTGVGTILQVDRSVQVYLLGPRAKPSKDSPTEQ
jgi:hypothetical protein